MIRNSPILFPLSRKNRKNGGDKIVGRSNGTLDSLDLKRVI